MKVVYTTPPFYYNGSYSVHVWSNTNIPGSFVIVEVSRNGKVTGWSPGK
jgi:hypothetical protein